MIYIITVAAAIAGWIHSGFFTAIVGGTVGYLFCSVLELRQRLDRLEEKRESLHDSIRQHPVTKKVTPTLTSEPPLDPPEREQGWYSPSLHVHQEAKAIAAPSSQSANQPWEESLFVQAVKRFLTGGNLVVKAGVIILFFGVSFLVKYAAEHSYLPVELRLSIVGAGAIALLVVGWRLRVRRPGYALAVQGGAVGIIYLTIFASFRLYHLLPGTLAFPLLLILCLLSATLAVLQDSSSLAVLGACGGFLAPVLVSTGGGSHVALFSYYAVLNLGIIGIAWFKAWRPLNVVGFGFTFVISALWGARFYNPAFLASTEPFLILFFVMYAAVGILFALRQPPKSIGYVDGTLVFGTPVVAFALQARVVEGIPFALAWSAVVLALFYVSIAFTLYRLRPLDLRLLSESFLAFSIVFISLAVPLAFDGRWTSAAWSVEGAALVWAGLRQKRLLPRVFGMLLQFGAGIAFVTAVDAGTGPIPVVNGFFSGCALIASSSLVSGWLCHRYRDSLGSGERPFAHILAVWGILWWVGGGIHELDRFLLQRFLQAGILSFVAVSCAIWSLLERRLVWPFLRYPALGLLPVMAFVALIALLDGGHPLGHGGVVAWPVALSVNYWLLYRYNELRAELLHFFHAASFWLFGFLLSWEIYWQTSRWVEGSHTWALCTWGAIPATLILFVTMRSRLFAWPMDRYRDVYLFRALIPFAAAAWLWVLFVTFTQTGDPAPLPYQPLLNPLDLTSICILVVLFAWHSKLREAQIALLREIPGSYLSGIYMATIFLWLNGVLVRTIHHWGNVPFSADAMLQSVLFQVSLSLFWTIMSLCTMVVATRRKSRVPWLVGAGLLAVVVLKLFLIDLAQRGTVERIISFVGVGCLLLVIGYFSPVPPRLKEDSP